MKANTMPKTTFNPAIRGYHAVYREAAVNHCPGCGHTHWLIGRTTAECAFCSTALPLDFSLATPTEGEVIAVNDNHLKIKESPNSLAGLRRSNVVPLTNIRSLFDSNLRGYHAVYREAQTNHCPGCGRTHWYKGRLSAECAFCATTLPLDSALNTTAETEMIYSHDNHRLTKGEGNNSVAAYISS